MYRVIPVFNTRNINDSFKIIDEEKLVIDFVIKKKKTSNLKAIIPFYYQFVLIDISDYYVLIADPQNTDIVRLNYKIPDLSTIEFQINSFNPESGDFIILLEKIRKELSIRLRSSQWLPRGLILEKIIDKQKLLSILEDLLRKSILSKELRGYVFKHDTNYELITRNKQVFYQCLSDIVQIQNKLSLILEKLHEIKYYWLSIFNMRYIERFNELGKTYNIISYMVEKSIRDLNKKLDLECRKLQEKYRIMINNIKHKISLIDMEIEKIGKRIKYSDSNSRNNYKDLLKELKKKKNILHHRMLKLKKESLEKTSLIKKQYKNLFKIENMRKQFYMREKIWIEKDYEKKIRRIDYLLGDIEIKISKINNILERTRQKITRFSIKLPGFTQQIIYLKGYIVLGDNFIEIITPSYIQNTEKTKFKIIKPLYNYLINNIRNKIRSCEELFRYNILNIDGKQKEYKYLNICYSS